MTPAVIHALDEGHREQPIAIDIAEYLKSRIEDLLVLQPNRQITFISKPLIIKASYDLVDNLLGNVITNARVHSPVDAPIQFVIDGKKVIIEDGGPGLKEIPDKPFKRFESPSNTLCQAKSFRTTGSTGSNQRSIPPCKAL